MSVEQSGQPWLYEPGTTDPLQEPAFNEFEDHNLVTPPVDPAVAAPAYETGRRHTPSWAHEPYTEVSAFTAPLHTLEPAYGEPMYAQVFAEQNPDVVATQQSKKRAPVASSISVMTLQDRGPLVKEGEYGSIFDAMNKERAGTGTDYTELRRPFRIVAQPFERIDVAPQAPTPARVETATPPVTKEVPRAIAAVTPVKAIAPETPRAVITVKGEQEGSVAAVIEEEQTGLSQSETTAFLTRVLRGLEKSRDEDLAAEKAQAETQAYAEKAERDKAEADAKAEADRIAAEEQLARDVAIIEAAAPKIAEAKQAPVEQAPAVIHEERLTFNGIRAAAKEVIANHKKAARIAEYAGVAVVAVAAGARLFGRFRRR